jgi:hypothetical protein
LILRQESWQEIPFGAKIKGLAMTDVDDELVPDEIARRRDAAIKRAVNTPPSPTKNLLARPSAPATARDQEF